MTNASNKNLGVWQKLSQAIAREVRLTGLSCRLEFVWSRDQLGFGAAREIAEPGTQARRSVRSRDVGAGVKGGAVQLANPSPGRIPGGACHV